MKHIPNILSLLRIILSIFLFCLKPQTTPFVLVYLICGLSDVLDGFLARKLDAISELGSRLDSISDIIFIFVVLFKFIPILNLNAVMLIWLGTIALLKVACIVVIFTRFEQFGMVHTYMNKLTGLLIFIYPILNYFIICRIYVYIIFICASIAVIEEILIDITMESLELDRKNY